jgi:DUF1016 N-terminal domain
MPKNTAPPPSSNPDTQIVPEAYEDFLRALKQRIRQAQIRVVLSVNRELVLLYWQTGRDILERQGRAGWGAKIIDQLSKDLHHDFPEVKGFSPLAGEEFEEVSDPCDPRRKHWIRRG